MYAISFSKPLRVVVMHVELQMKYELELSICGNELSLLQVLFNSPQICTAIYGNNDIQHLQVNLHPLPVQFLAYPNLALYILSPNDTTKYPRNLNATLLEKIYNLQFFGSLIISFSTVSHPFSFYDFTLNDLKQLQKYMDCMSMGVNELNPPQSDDYTIELSEEAGRLEQLLSSMDLTTFFIYRYKTAYCPNIDYKHDWSKCIYAHRHQDFRLLDYQEAAGQDTLFTGRMLFNY